MVTDSELAKVIDAFEKRTKKLEDKIDSLESTIKTIVAFFIIALIITYFWGFKVVITLTILVALVANYVDSKKKRISVQYSNEADLNNEKESV